jgi:hypothetical protein
MIITTIKYNGSKLKLGGFGFRKYQMVKLGEIAVASVKARVAKGVGSDDATMKPLNVPYANWKARHGMKPVRDLSGPGGRTYVEERKGKKYTRTVRAESAHMLDNFTVRYADEMTVRMDITANWARIRARSNEQRAPWFGFSTNDTRAIAEAAQKMFGGIVTDLAVRLKGKSGSPIWMNPAAMQDDFLRKVS